MARTNMPDPAEQFVGAEFEPASDGRESAGPIDPVGEDDPTGFAEAGLGEGDGLLTAGDALATAVERDILGLGFADGWEGPDLAEEFGGQDDARALTDIIESGETDADKESAIKEVMAERGQGVAEAAHHLSTLLTESDEATVKAIEDDRDGAADKTAGLAQEVDRVTHTSRDAAAIMVGALRSNVGTSAAASATAGLVNYT